MYVLVVKLPGQVEEKRFVSSLKANITHMLSIARDRHGEDGFHYRIWKDGWCEASFEAWRYINYHTGPATVI